MVTKAKSAATVLQDFLSKLEVDALGVVSLQDWKGTRLEESARKLLPEARSVIVLAMETYREILDLTSPEKVAGAASLNEVLVGSNNFLNGRLTKACFDVAKAAHKLGLKALPLPPGGCPTDARFLQSVFSFKHAARAAGLGTFGKHSLIITPDFGPRVRLACCLTEATLEPAKGNPSHECGNCRLCLENCPSQALAEPPAGEAYAINKFACSAFRKASDACVECLRLCPTGQ